MSRKEVRRQLVHLLFGLLYAFLFYLGFLTPLISLAFLLLFIAISLFLKAQESWIHHFILLLERDHDLNQFPLRGPIFFLLGTTITISLFSFEAALGALIVLSFVDSIGTAYGKTLGRIKVPWNRQKHLEGPVIGGVLSALIGLLFLSPVSSILGSTVGAFLDTLNPHIGRLRLDDNLTIPLLSGVVLHYSHSIVPGGLFVIS